MPAEVRAVRAADDQRPGRQFARKKQVQAAIEAAGELDAQIIVTNVADNEHAELCRELGCHLAVGPLYGAPNAAPQVR